MSEDMVTLQSQDGMDVTVARKVAELSKTVKNLIDDAGIEDPIPLPNVEGNILLKVVEYMKHYTENPVVESKDEKADKTTDISGWDLEYCQLDQPTLFKVILASNYLDIEPLLNLTCKSVASLIRGRTPSEIKATFNITGDFSEAEEKQVREENQWLEVE